MKCPNCGTENDGKFCQSCGAQPVNDGEFEQIELYEQPDTRFFEQTNAPIYNSAPKSGKTAIIITAVIAGAVAVMAIVFGVIVCTLINKTPELIDKMEEYEETSVYAEENSDSENSGNELSGFLSDYYCEGGSEDSDSQLIYEDSTIYDGVKIVNVADGFYDKYEASDEDTVTVEIPAQIDGKNVVEIEWLPMYIDESKSVRLVLPDTVKIIRSFAVAYVENMTEVQFGSGLVTIGDSAFIGDIALTEVTIPSSVTSLDACGLGIYFDNDGSEQKNTDFIIHGEKGSAAEKYAMQYGFTFKGAESSADKSAA